MNKKGKSKSRASHLVSHSNRVEELTTVVKSYTRLIAAISALAATVIASGTAIGLGIEGIPF